MSFDAKSIFLVLVFAAAFTAAQAAVGLMSTATERRKLNQRLKVADKAEGIAALVTELRKQRGLTAAGERSGQLQWLSDLIVASGLPYDQKKWLTYVGGVALIGAIGGFALTHNPVGVLAGAFMTGA